MIRANSNKLQQPLATLRIATAVAAACAAMLGANGAAAFEFNTGNPDLSVRWDNTFRYNLAQRIESRDPKIGNAGNSDEGTYSFDREDLVSNRLDVLSELDIVFRKRFGARISGAGWYDAAYDDDSKTNPNPPLTNLSSYVGKKYSDYIKRYYQGPSGELLDAFVFGTVDIGNAPTSAKIGRHTIYWGESLFLNGNLHSVAYAQNPLDLQKGFATPGTEAKELFRPLNQISLSSQVTDTLSVAAQYLLQWESFRYPEGGTYLGPVDFAFNGPDRVLLAQLPNVPALGALAGQQVGAARGTAAEPSNTGEWGLAARWSPEWLDGTMGFYYRNYADKLPQALLTRRTLTPALPGVGAVPLASGSEYNLMYADRIDLYGVSLAKNIAGISVGAELSYRKNTPLNAQILGFAPGLPAEGETRGPRGDTYHGLINGLGVIPKTGIFDAATYAAELTWSQLVEVSSGANLFNGVGYAPCTGRDKYDGCSTKNYYGLSAAFTPTWYQVFPGVDLSAPLTYSMGLSGNAATVFGGNDGNGNYSIGLSADVFQKYRFDLKYIDYLGKYRDNGTAVTTQNGFTTLLKDRGFISLTARATF